MGLKCKNQNFGLFQGHIPRIFSGMLSSTWPNMGHILRHADPGTHPLEAQLLISVIPA